MVSMRRRWTWVFVATAALTLLSCTGGDDEDSDGGRSPTATEPPSAGGAVAASASASVPQATSTPTPADEFATVLGRLNEAVYRIDYAFTTRTGGQEFAGGLTWIRAADGRERFETSSEQAGDAFRLVVITDADGGRVTCFDVGGFSSCFRGDDGPLAEIPNPTQILFQNVLDPDRIDSVRETATRQILGLDVTCYEVDAGGGSSEACIADGNLLLSASWTAPNGDGGGFEASEFGTDITDEDFEPIAPIAN